MALSKKQAGIVDEITKKYGRTLDLKASPGVLIEILRNYGRVVDDDNGGGGTGGVSPSTIAGSGPPPAPPAPSEGPGDVRLADIMKAVLNLQRDVQTIRESVSQKAGKATKASR